MKQEFTFRIILEKPPAGADFGLQKGSGSVYETVQKQRSVGKDMHFEFTLEAKSTKDPMPIFLGPFAQGPPHERFVYLDIGTCAGQLDSPWSRRLKIPLRDITWNMLQSLTGDSQGILETRVMGTGKDGTPSCATVKPFEGWKVSR